jgi:hypothetical protein
MVAIKEKGGIRESEPSGLDRRAGYEMPETAEKNDDGSEAIDYAAIARARHQVAENIRVTFYQTGAASAAEAKSLQDWADNLEKNPDGLKGIDSFIGYLKQQVQSAMTLYYSELRAPLASAVSRRLISQRSHDKWVDRFRSSGVTYKQKEYWVEYQLPHYMAAWEKNANERKALLANPALKQLPKNADVLLLQNESAFLDLHFDKRVDLLAKVRAAITVDKRDKGSGVYKQLHAKASGLLYAAVAEGIMSSSKVGTWQERIFKSNAKPEVIMTFLNGGGTSLQALMQKWREVRHQYDDICRKGAPLKNPAVGMYMIPPERFLRMHYAQRKAWVNEADQRIRDATNIESEVPTFIRIRHALDVKDWDDAQHHIDRIERRNAASKVKLSPENWDRLQSMKRYLTQMRNDKKKEKDKDGKPKDKAEVAKGVCARITEVVNTGIPTSMQATVLKLLRSPFPNRGIHQLRWIVYNNKWCRDHHFLDYERSKAGASKESSELTNERTRKGIDTGRRQDHVLNSQNSGQEHMRTNDYAKRRATLTHVDIGAGSDGTSTLATWLEKPQHPRDLYWRTLCVHAGGVPMSESWHNELFSSLTTLRSLTVELERSGFMYGGLGLLPVSRN